jgi:hypothetical protein
MKTKATRKTKKPIKSAKSAKKSKKTKKSAPKKKVDIKNLAVLRTKKLTKDRIIILTHKIKELLLKYKPYRDNDVLLCNRMQKDELKKLKLKPRIITTDQFMKLRNVHALTTEETICRLRRKVQQLYPRTRGKKYKMRQNKALEVIQDMEGMKSGLRRVKNLKIRNNWCSDRPLWP